MPTQWLDSEELLLQWTVESLMQGSSIVLLAPDGADSTDAAFEICRRLWQDRRLTETVFPAAYDEIPHGTWVPEAVVTNVIGARDPIVDGDSLIRWHSEKVPVIVVLTDMEPPTNLPIEEFLRRWSDYLRRFKGEVEAGAGLRVLMTLKPRARCLKRTTILPEPLRLAKWSPPAGLELLELGRESIVNILPGVSDEALHFLTLRVADLAGNRKADLLSALKIIETLENDEYDRIVWDTDSFPVKKAVRWLQQTTHDLPAILRILSVGGFLLANQRSEFQHRFPGVIDRLWVGGLWTEGPGLSQWEMFTPAAVTALRQLAQDSSVRNGYLLNVPPDLPDSVTLDLLKRCVFLEQLLRQRIIVAISASGAPPLLEKAFIGLESATGRQVSRGGSEPLRRLLEVMQKSTLGGILGIARGLTNTSETQEQRAFKRIRNDLAHGDTATWRMHYAGFSQIEDSILRFAAKIGVVHAPAPVTSVIT